MNYAFMFRTKKIDYAKIRLSRDKKIDFKGLFGDSEKEMRDVEKEKRKLFEVDRMSICKDDENKVFCAFLGFWLLVCFGDTPNKRLYGKRTMALR